MRARLFNTWQKRLVSIIVATLFSAAWFPAGIFATDQALRFKLTYGTDCYMEPEFFANGGVSNEQICYATQLDGGRLLLAIVLSVSGVCMVIVIRKAVGWILDAVKQNPHEAPPSDPEKPVLTYPTYFNRASSTKAS